MNLPKSSTCTESQTVAPEGASPGLLESLKVLDELRAAVVSGEVAAFWAVTIGHDDATFAWSGATVPISRIRELGAITHMLGSLHAGKFD